MRKVVLYHLLSLDGIAFEDAEWFTDDGPEMFANLGRVIATQDDILLGRGTYDYWAGYWPTSDMEPFAGFINGTTKHVVTSSPLKQEWANTTVVSAPVAEYVSDLKNQSGGEIGIHGSIELARSLLRDQVIDELQLVVAPAVVGHGRRVFDTDVLQTFDLLDVERSAKGTLFLTYRRAIAGT